MRRERIARSRHAAYAAVSSMQLSPSGICNRGNASRLPVERHPKPLFHQIPGWQWPEPPHYGSNAIPRWLRVRSTLRHCEFRIDASPATLDPTPSPQLQSCARVRGPAHSEFCTLNSELIRPHPSSSGPGHRPLTAATRVRIPSGVRSKKPFGNAEGFFVARREGPRRGEVIMG